MDGSAVLVWGGLKVLEGILVIYVILAMKEIRAKEAAGEKIQ